MRSANLQAHAAARPVLKGRRAVDLLTGFAVVVAVPALFWLGVLEVAGWSFGFAVTAWTQAAAVAMALAVLLPVWAGLTLGRDRR